MRCYLRNLILMFCITSVFIGCADDSTKMEEPLNADQVDDDPAGSDENGGSLESPSEDMPPSPEEPAIQEFQNEMNSSDMESDESEAAEDSAVSEPEGASPQAAPSEKGGIISSGVKKEKKRCRLIADELERQKCLREQAK
jgi:hypothetical protein